VVRRAPVVGLVVVRVEVGERVVRRPEDVDDCVDPVGDDDDEERGDADADGSEVHTGDRFPGRMYLPAPPVARRNRR